MKHEPSCNWEKSNCSWKETHNYCPHAEHACNCHQNNKKGLETFLREKKGNLAPSDEDIWEYYIAPLIREAWEEGRKEGARKQALMDADLIKKAKKTDVLPELYRIWSSIPLTQGTVARKMMKELIDRLEGKKK